MKCEIERMEINYTFYFFAFLRKMIKKLLTFCYWKDRKVYFDIGWCPSGSVQSETNRQPDLYGRTGLIQYWGEKSSTVWPFIHNAVYRNRKPSSVLPICHIIQCLKQITVNHADQIIHAGVGIRNTAKQCYFFLPDTV